MRIILYLRRTRLDRGDSRKVLHMEKSKRMDTRTLTVLALFTALVVVLQLMGAFIKLGPFSISLTAVPIIVGAALYGPAAGAWLGGVFGLVVMFTDTALFMPVSPIGTILTVMLKGICGGFLSGLCYKALAEKNEWLAVLAASIVFPVVNTGLFLIGCRLFFMPLINEWAAAAGFASAGAFMVTGMVGLNFLVELAIDLVLSPVILRLVKLGRKETK